MPRCEDVEAPLPGSSPLLSNVGRDRRRGLQREDEEGHFTIAVVFESEHLSLATQCCYLPQAPTYINPSDKRDSHSGAPY